MSSSNISNSCNVLSHFHIYFFIYVYTHVLKYIFSENIKTKNKNSKQIYIHKWLNQIY
jgi:hypothetical protein